MNKKIGKWYPSRIKYWYPIRVVEATNLLPIFETAVEKPFVEFFAEGHIDQDGDLLCGQWKRQLRKTYKATSETLRVQRIEGVDICATCKTAFTKSTNPEAVALRRWTEGVPTPLH